VKSRPRLGIGGRLATAAVVATLIASCGSGRQGTGSPSTRAPSAPTTTVPLGASSSAGQAPPSSTGTVTVAPAAVAPSVACGALRPSNPPDGAALTVTASLGPTTAVLTGIAANDPGGLGLNDANLTVSTGARTVVAGPVRPPDRASAVIPLNVGPSKSSASPVEPLCLVRFTGDSQPTVLIGLYSGGAHCCTVLRAVSLSSRSVVDDDIGNPSASIATDAGHAIVVTADDAFNYTFTDYADSGSPLVVLEVQRGQFVNTTRQYQRLVASDAQKWMGLYHSQPDDGLGYLAAWTADECVAGQGAHAWATLDQLQHEGKLPGTPFSPGGAAFVRDLHQFLDHHGYCR
jgi:hypothetical protein